MPLDPINVKLLGQAGVNVDKSPLELNDNEMRQAQNAMKDYESGISSIRKRPGLVAFTKTNTAGTVLGGIGVPLQHLLTGVHTIYFGRGTK